MTFEKISWQIVLIVIGRVLKDLKCTCMFSHVTYLQVEGIFHISLSLPLSHSIILHVLKILYIIYSFISIINTLQRKTKTTPVFQIMTHFHPSFIYKFYKVRKYFAKTVLNKIIIIYGMK